MGTPAPQDVSPAPIHMANSGTPNQQVSRKQAIVVGLWFAAAGVAIVLEGLCIIPVEPAPEVRDSPWVIICAGLTFIFGGAAAIVGFAVAGGPGPDGDLRAGTPFAVRLVQYFLGLGIVGMMTAICSWIAFGRGHRQFSASFAVPFVAWYTESNEMVGRVAFGVAATLLWFIFAALGFDGARRLARWRTSDSQSRSSR
jgi:hypothetical protein